MTANDAGKTAGDARRVAHLRRLSARNMPSAITWHNELSLLSWSTVIRTIDVVERRARVVELGQD
jgi:hypothetical protein